MRVVLDTNVLLTSLLKTSKYRPIFDGLLSNKYDLVISHDILKSEEKSHKIIPVFINQDQQIQYP